MGNHVLSFRSLSDDQQNVFVGQEIRLKFGFDRRAGKKRSVKVKGTGSAPERDYRIHGSEVYTYTPSAAGSYTFTLEAGSSNSEGVSVSPSGGRASVTVHEKLKLAVARVEQGSNTSGPYALGTAKVVLERKDTGTWYPSAGVKVELRGAGLKRSVTHVLKSAGDLEVEVELAREGEFTLQVVPKRSEEVEGSAATDLRVVLPKLSVVAVKRAAGSPDLGDGVHVLGTAKAVIEVDDVKAVAQPSRAKFELRHPGLKRSVEARVPDRDSLSGSRFEVELPLRKPTDHPEELRIEALSRCEVDANASAPRVKVEAPKASFDHSSGEELVFADANSAKLKVKLSYPAPDKGVKVKLLSDRFKGGKPQEVRIPEGKGHPNAHEVALTRLTDAFASPQGVSLRAGEGSLLDPEGVNRVSVQLHPTVAFAEPWVDPEGPHRAGQQVTFKLQLTGPVPSGGAQLSLACSGFASSPHAFSLPAGKEGVVDVGPVELKALSGSSKQTDATLDVTSGSLRLGERKTQKLTIEDSGQPVSFPAEGWIEPVLEPNKHYRVGDKVTVTLRLPEAAESEVEVTLKSPLLGGDVQAKIPAGQQEARVELVFDKAGEKQPLRIEPGNNALGGERTEQKLTVRDARRLRFSSTWIKPKGPHHADQEVEVVVRLVKRLHGRWQHAQASRSEPVGYLVAPMSWKGDAPCFVTSSERWRTESRGSTVGIVLESTQGESEIRVPLTLKSLADLGLTDQEKEVTFSLQALDSSPPATLSSTSSEVQKKLKLEPYPLIAWAKKPFASAPLGTLDGQPDRWVFNPQDAAELRVDLERESFRDATAELSSPAFGDEGGNPKTFPVRWKKGKKRSEPVNVVFAKPGDYEIVVRACDGVRTEDQAQRKLKVHVQAGTRVGFPEGDDWFDRRPPFRQGDKAKIRLKTAGPDSTWAAGSSEQAGIKLISRLFSSDGKERKELLVDVSRDAWAQGTYEHEVTFTFGDGKEHTIAIEPVGGTGRPVVAKGTITERKLKVHGPRKLYFGSRFASRALDPEGPYRPGDLVRIDVHMSDPLPEGSDPSTVVGYLECSAFDPNHPAPPSTPPSGSGPTRIPLTFPAGERKRELEVLIKHDAAPGKVEIKLVAESAHTTLRDTKAYVLREVEIKPRPVVGFAEGAKAVRTEERRRLRMQAIDRAPEPFDDSGQTKWKSRVEHSATLRLELDHHASHRGVGVAVSSELFGPAEDNPGLVTVDDPKTEAPGEGLPDPAWGQYYKLAKVAELHEAWKHRGQAPAGLSDGAVVRWDGEKWVVAPHREYLVRWKKTSSKGQKVEVTFKKSGEADVSLIGPFCAKPHTQRAKLRFRILSEVVLFPHYATVELDPTTVVGTFARGQVLTGKDSQTTASIVAAGKDLLYVEKSSTDFVEGEEVYVADSRGGSSARAKVKRSSQARSWVQPPTGPYSVGDRVAFRLLRITDDASKAGALATLTCHAFCEKDSRGKLVPLEVTWKAGELLSEPLSVFLSGIDTTGARIDLAGLVDATRGVDYAVAGEREKKIKVQPTRTLTFGRRFLAKKPLKIGLHEPFSVPVHLSTPAPRDVSLRLTGQGLKEPNGYEATIAQGGSGVTIEGVEYERRPASGSGGPDEATLELVSCTPWLLRFRPPAGDASGGRPPPPPPPLRPGDELEGANSHSTAKVLESQESAFAPVLVEASGSFTDGEELSPAGGGSGSAPRVLATAQPLYEVGEESESTHPVEIRVPVVRISKVLTETDEKRDGLPAYAQLQEVEFLLKLDRPATPGTSCTLDSFAFDAVAVDFAPGSKVARAKVRLLAQATDDQGQSKAVAGKQTARLRPSQESCTVHADKGTRDFYVVDLPQIGFAPDPEDDDPQGYWIAPGDELAVGDKAKVRVRLTQDPQSTTAQAPVHARLVSEVFDADVPFEIERGVDKEILVTIAKAVQRNRQKASAAGTTIKLAVDKGALLGPDRRRPIRVHAHRKAHFTRAPLSLPPRPAPGYSVTPGPPWKLSRDAGDWSFTAHGGEPAFVAHGDRIVYELRDPGDVPFVPGDKVRLSVGLTVPAAEGGAKVKVGGAPVKAPQEASFAEQDDFEVVEVELANPSASPQELTLSSYVNCKAGAKAKHPIRVHLPKVSLADPCWDCEVARPNTVVTVHLTLDAPAPYRGCKVALDLTKSGGGSAWGKDEAGQPVVVEAHVPAGATEARVVARIDPELAVADAAAGDEYELCVKPVALTFPTGSPLAGKLKAERCEAHPSNAKRKVRIFPAQKVRFAQKPLKLPDGSEDAGSWSSADPKEFNAATTFEVGAKDRAILVVEPNTKPDEGEHVVRIRSRAFGPRVYEARLKKTADPVEVEVKFLNGLKSDYAAEFPFPIELEAPEGFVVDPQRGRLRVQVELPPEPSTEQKCPLAADDSRAASTLSPEEKRAIREALEPKPEPCNVSKAVLVEEHGTEEDPKWPERGGGAGAGAFELVPRLDLAVDAEVDDKGRPLNTLVCSRGELPRLQVLAGRPFDSSVDESGAAFHETRVRVKLRTGGDRNYWCGSVFQGAPELVDKGLLPKRRRHPFVRVSTKVGDDWVPLEDGLVDARALLDEDEECTVITFPVHQAFHFWQFMEEQPGNGRLKRYGKRAVAVSEDVADTFGVKLNPFGAVRDLLSILSFARMQPKLYKVEVESCGQPKGTDPAGPSERLAAIVEVYPSDEFCFSLSVSFPFSFDQGSLGSYYDPKQKCFRSVDLNAPPKKPKKGESPVPIKGTSSRADENAKQGVSVEAPFGEGLSREQYLACHVDPGSFLLRLSSPVDPGTPAKIGPSSQGPWELDADAVLAGEADGAAFDLVVEGEPASVLTAVEAPFDFRRVGEPCDACPHGRHEHPNGGACRGAQCPCRRFVPRPCTCSHGLSQHPGGGACQDPSCPSGGCSGYSPAPKAGYSAPTQWTLEIEVDGQVHSVALSEASFGDPAAASPSEVADALNAALGGDHALAEGERVRLSSAKRGRSARLRVKGGTANFALRFPSHRAEGTSYFQDLSAVTPTEVAKLLEAACPGLTVSCEDKKLTVLTKSANADSRLLLRGSGFESLGLSPLDTEVKGADAEDPPPSSPERGRSNAPSLVYHPVSPAADDSPAWDVNGKPLNNEVDEGGKFMSGEKTLFASPPSPNAPSTHPFAFNHANLESGAFWGKAGTKLKVSLSRNGRANPAYYEVINTVYGMVRTAIGVGQSITTLSNGFQWAVGFGVQATVKFLDGTLNVYWGFKEHSDRRVFRWYAIQANLTLADFSFALTFGFQAALLMLRFEALIYLKIKLEAKLEGSFEKTAPGLRAPSWCDTWLGFDALVEAGLRMVLVHENVFHLGAAIKTGVRAEFRLRNPETDPPGLEYRLFWPGVSALATFRVVGIKSVTKEVWFIQGSPPDWPFKKGTIPSDTVASQGYDYYLEVVADTWGRLASQRAKILESLTDWQTCQLWLVKRARKQVVRRRNPETQEVETVSKHLETELLPGHRFDPRNFEDEGAWSENRRKWERQWKACYDAFHLEQHSHRKRIRARPVDQRLLHHANRVQKHMERFTKRLERIERNFKELKKLRVEAEKAREQADTAERVPERLWEALRAIRDKDFLAWRTGSDLIKHPLDKVQDSLKSLYYWGKERREW